MNSTVKDKWVKALNSDDYKQGYGGLAYINQEGIECHCALGVLCEIAHKEGVCPKSNNVNGFVSTSPGKQYMAYGLEGSVSILPKEVKEWAGYSDSPCIAYDRNLYYGTFDVDYLNDRVGLSFKEIAKLIEEQL